MPEPKKCCCHAPDPGECFRSRHSVDPGGFHGEYDDECECVCHATDEDGYSEWDDKNQPPPSDLT